MSLTLDYGQGWKFVVNPITVTLTRQQTGTAQTVPYVLKRESTLEDVQQEPAMIEEETTVFHLWQDHLAGTVPAKGDQITTPDEATWHVVRRQTQNHGRKYRLLAFLER